MATLNFFDSLRGAVIVMICSLYFWAPFVLKKSSLSSSSMACGAHGFLSFLPPKDSTAIVGLVDLAPGLAPACIYSSYFLKASFSAEDLTGASFGLLAAAAYAAYICCIFCMFSRAEWSIFFGMGLGAGFFFSSSLEEFLRKKDPPILAGAAF